MHGQWVLDDMSSLTYVETSRPCSPQFEYISEDQTPWLAVSCPQSQHEQSQQSPLKAYSVFDEGLSTPTRCSRLRPHPQSNQTEYSSPRRMNHSSAGLQSSLESVWMPPQTCQQLPATNITSNIDGEDFTTGLTEVKSTHRQTDMSESQMQYPERYAIMNSDCGEQWFQEIPDLDDYSDWNEFGYSHPFEQTTMAESMRSICPPESLDNAKPLSRCSNLYPLVDQPLLRTNCTMGYNMRLPLARLDKYLVALRQIIRRCCEATTIT